MDRSDLVTVDCPPSPYHGKTGKVIHVDELGGYVEVYFEGVGYKTFEEELLKPATPEKPKPRRFRVINVDGGQSSEGVQVGDVAEEMPEYSTDPKYVDLKNPGPWKPVCLPGRVCFNVIRVEEVPSDTPLGRPELAKKPKLVGEVDVTVTTVELTLRDLFALAALHAATPTIMGYSMSAGPDELNRIRSMTAKSCYAYADAMIAARTPADG